MVRCRRLFLKWANASQTLESAVPGTAPWITAFLGRNIAMTSFRDRNFHFHSATYAYPIVASRKSTCTIGVEMATQSQIDANRRNAQKSTGPTTPEGRAAVRHNALKHGLTAEILIPSMEDQPDFDRLCDAFETEYQPVGPTEESLLENLAAAKWRLSRAHRKPAFVKRAIELSMNQEYRACQNACWAHDRRFG
jgi:hypothetical protein